MKLYAVRDKKTGLLVNNLSTPRKKFWEKRGHAQNAIDKYNAIFSSFHALYKADLELVEYELVEVLKG